MTLNPHPERDYLPAKQCDCTRLEQRKADELARVTAERDRLREMLRWFSSQLVCASKVTGDTRPNCPCQKCDIDRAIGGNTEKARGE